MQSATYDLSHLTKDQLIDLLESLVKNAPYQGMSFFGARPFDRADASKVVNGYIDYYCGKPIKIDFRDLTSVDPRLYNRDAGPGAFEAVLKSI